jgi:hypothetical protein
MTPAGRTTVSRGHRALHVLIYHPSLPSLTSSIGQLQASTTYKAGILNRSLLVRLTDEGVCIARRSQLIIMMGLLVQMQAS